MFETTGLTQNNTYTLKVYIDGVPSADPAGDGITFTSSDTEEIYLEVSDAGVVTVKNQRPDNTITITVTKGSSSVTLNTKIN